MLFELKMSPVLLVALCLWGFCSLATAGGRVTYPPELDYLFPAGAQRGTTVRVQLGGRYLETANEILLPCAGEAREITAGKPAVTVVTLGGKNERASFASTTSGTTSGFEISATAEPGFHEVRVATRGGVSNARRFVVGDLTEVMECESNDDFAEAESVAPPVTINGQIGVSEDVDNFRFEAAVGERFIFRVEARRFASPLDAVIELFDDAGNLVARAESFVGGDPILDVSIPKTASYVVRIRDLSYKGSSSRVYRLSLGVLPHIDYVMPAGVERGTKYGLLVTGRNLPATFDDRSGDPPTIAERPLDVLVSEVFVPATSSDSIRALRITGTGGASNEIPLRVDGFSDRSEKEPNDFPLRADALETIPCAVTGQFAKAEDQDFFSVDLKKGKAVVFEVFSRRLGYQTDCSLAVLDKGGKVLVEADDQGKNRDPKIDFTPPEDGLYLVRLGELRSPNRGRVDLVYRLEVCPKDLPRLRLSASVDRVNIPCGGAAIVRLSTDGSQGLVDSTFLEFDGLPPGVTITNTRYPEPTGLTLPGVTSVSFILDVSPEATLESGLFTIRGNALIKKQNGSFEQQSVAAIATYYEARSPIDNSEIELRETTTLAYSITDSPGFRLELGPSPLTTRDGDEISVTVTVHREPGFDEEILLQSAMHPPTVSRALGVKVLPGESTGKYVWNVSPGAPMKGSIAVRGVAQPALAGAQTRSRPPAIRVVSRPIEADVKPVPTPPEKADADGK